ncbi:MAG: Smr/MutS family protein [Deltaproteobacteria bacterium]|nr:Smr/MutS family protein [Deltaproteobacteria bacterium]
MPIRVTQKTLESLEWPQIIARLRNHCRTPLARQRLGARSDSGDSDDSDRAEIDDAPQTHSARAREDSSSTVVELACALPELEQGLSGTRERLGETREALALLEGGAPPLAGGLVDLSGVFRRATLGGVLAPEQLRDLLSSLEALTSATRLLAQRADEAPRLAALAELVEDHRELTRRIDGTLDPSGEVRDSASAELARARREAKGLAADLQRRLSRYLQDPNVSPGLSDDYYTVRNDRYVLPVRADARGRVRGIVHDASRSGTTLFVEPEAVVELNNRLKQAELGVAREVERILRALSAAVAAAVPLLEADLRTLATLDLAFARARLAQEMEAVEPEVGRDGVFDLPQLRHPLLPVDEAVANDLCLGDPHTVLVISGPNGGGKTVAMKAVGLAAVMVRMGLFVPAAPGARVDLIDDVQVDIGDGQDIRESLSTFSAHMQNLAGIVDRASPHSLVLLDELGVGTDPSEGAALAQAVLEKLADEGGRVITTTHYNLLKEMADADTRFCNASVEFDPETLVPTYRLHVGSPGVSSATAVAARMGMPGDVLERTNALLQREDRQLDRMLSELAASRAALEKEQRAAAQVRSEGETARDEYRVKLERLQERRDKLFHGMRADLDAAFKEAHGRVAKVIRDLQRSGAPDSRSGAREAARAREQLLALEEGADRAREAAGIAAAAEPGTLPARDRIDWRHVAPGDPVIVPGGASGVLASLPDRRGRVGVRVGSAKLVVEADRVRAAPQGGAGARPEPRQRAPQPEADGEDEEATLTGDLLEVDLRGMRVEEALDRLAQAIDDALRRAGHGLRIIHGFGTGALRSAVREHLSASPLIENHRPGERNEGGDGVTLATLRP